MIRSRFALVACCVLLVCASAGVEARAQHESGSQANAAPRPSLGLTATVRGTVMLKGTLPAKVASGADPGCSDKAVDSREIVASDEHLANALVYLKEARDPEALARKSITGSKTPVVVTVDDCGFHSHVVAIETGQSLKFVNRGGAGCRVRAGVSQDAAAQEIAVSLLPNSKPVVRTFSHKAVMLPVTCEQHPGMRMYLSAFPHRFFAVTGSDGRFEITGLLPGRYTISVVHEKLGEEARQIEVGPKQEKFVDFTFNTASIH